MPLYSSHQPLGVNKEWILLELKMTRNIILSLPVHGVIVESKTVQNVVLLVPSIYFHHFFYPFLLKTVQAVALHWKPVLTGSNSTFLLSGPFHDDQLMTFLENLVCYVGSEMWSLDIEEAPFRGMAVVTTYMAVDICIVSRVSVLNRCGLDWLLITR